MKKILCIFSALLLYAGCKKENILWIEPGHEYQITNILVKNPSGTMEDVLPLLFPAVDRLTFTKYHPLGVAGDGTVKVYRTNYQAVDYSQYGAVYDPECGCYYYDWYTYTVWWSNNYVNQYRFDWDKESQRRISLQFSKYDPFIQGQGSGASFWSLLDRDYVVWKDSRKQGTMLADVIVLKGDGVEIVLRR